MSFRVRSFLICLRRKGEAKVGLSVFDMRLAAVSKVIRVGKEERCCHVPFIVYIPS